MRLDNRWLDLRVPANNAIMRIKSGVSQLFREALLAKEFVEIHTPKLISGESEGGADVFRTEYFGQVQHSHTTLIPRCIHLLSFSACQSESEGLVYLSNIAVSVCFVYVCHAPCTVSLESLSRTVSPAL